MPHTDPYLIAHIVRGQPAFDIAIRLQIGDEEGWIIPTSGHRAYPYWHCCLGDHLALDGILDDPPPDWPDHYTTHAAPGFGLITNLAERLGFLPKTQKVRRR